MQHDNFIEIQLVIEWLSKQQWVKVPHSRGTLLDHLLGTFAILRAADATLDQQLGGLLHSVYGTSSFRNPIATAKRGEVSGLVGTAAEELVYEFSISKRPDRFSGILAGDGAEIEKSLLIIECANLLEQRAGNRFLLKVSNAIVNGQVQCPFLIASMIFSRTSSRM